MHQPHMGEKSLLDMFGWKFDGFLVILKTKCRSLTSIQDLQFGKKQSMLLTVRSLRFFFLIIITNGCDGRLLCIHPSIQGDACKTYCCFLSVFSRHFNQEGSLSLPRLKRERRQYCSRSRK